MSDLYDDLYDRVGAFRDAGFEPDQIVVSAGDWDAIKDAAEVNEGEGYAGGDETLINGVVTLWSGSVSTPKIVFKEDRADE